MPVPIHGDLQRSMASECLYRLRREPGFYPSRHGKVAKRVPIKTTGWGIARRVPPMGNFKIIKKRAETAFHQVVMTDVVALVIWKNQIVRRLEFRSQFPRFQHRRELAGYRNSSYASR